MHVPNYLKEGIPANNSTYSRVTDVTGSSSAFGNFSPWRTPLKSIAIALSFFFSLSSVAFAESTKFVRAPKKVSNQYIVMFDETVVTKSEIPAFAAGLAALHGGRVLTTFENVISGFLIETTEGQAISLSNHSQVKWVEENAVGRLSQTSPQSTPFTNPSSMSAHGASQWGLDRIDRPNPSALRLNDSYAYCSTGEGTRIYVLDNGVWPGHPEFSQTGVSRVDPAPVFAQVLTDAGIGFSQSCYQAGAHHSSGTHGLAVASIAAGKTFGVAKRATVVDLRVAG